MTIKDPKTGLLHVFKHISMHNPEIPCPEATLKKYFYVVCVWTTLLIKVNVGKTLNLLIVKSTNKLQDS